jgi:hypothetical protein
MKYEKHVNRLMNFFAEQTKVPKDKLHLLNITPEKIENAIQTLINHKIPISKAVKHLESIWHNSSPDYPKGVSAKEMDLMGFQRVNNQWIHSITGTTYTDEQLTAHSFQEVEQSILNHPLYHLSKIKP